MPFKKKRRRPFAKKLDSGVKTLDLVVDRDDGGSEA
jgi:hypothetical protein